MDNCFFRVGQQVTWSEEALATRQDRIIKFKKHIGDGPNYTVTALLDENTERPATEATSHFLIQVNDIAINFSPVWFISSLKR